MSDAANLEVKCADFLEGNRRLYAHKAKRKKIALVCVEAANRGSGRIRIEFGGARLQVAGQDHLVEPPGVIIRKFSEFTWDFVIYSIVDFNPVLVFIDTFFFLTGPLYNRRLRKQLHLLSNSDMILGAGECRRAILGFRGVRKGSAQMCFSYRRDDGEPQQLKYEVPHDPH